MQSTILFWPTASVSIVDFLGLGLPNQETSHATLAVHARDFLGAPSLTEYGNVASPRIQVQLTSHVCNKQRR
jgi:hypothetical protein